MRTQTRNRQLPALLALLWALSLAAGGWAAAAASAGPSAHRELIVLLAMPPGAPSPEQVIAGFHEGRPLPAGLDSGCPLNARFLLPFRATGAVRETLASQPDSPRARLERTLVLTYGPETDLDRVTADLLARPEVLRVERDRPVRFSATTNDPFFAPVPNTNDYQWGLHILKVPQAWDWTTGHAYVGVADHGIDQSHPDLLANYRPHLSWNLQDNDADVDELVPKAGGGFAGGHGTHVSGIIAATPNNSIGGSGVCWNCSLLMGRGESLTAQAISLTWLVDHGVQLINASWGNPTISPIIQDGVEYAKQHDVLIVAAAGNDLAAAVEYPASDPGAIGVGGIKPDGTFWERPNHSVPCTECGSNSGPDLDLVAPAENVRSTMYPGISNNEMLGCMDRETPPSASTDSDGYGLCTGTSMSTPHVTGIAALLRSINPLLSIDNIRDLLITNASQASSFTNQLGYGIPNAAASVVEAFGCANGAALKNRLTPLFGFYSPEATDRFYTTIPQMASAAIVGFLHEKCSHPGRQVLSVDDCYGELTPASYEPTGITVASYPDFPGTCNISPCGDAPRASVYIFTTERAPFAGAPALVPLYRLTNNPLNTSLTSTDHHRDVTYTTSAQGISLFTGMSYKLDGIEGYIYPRCTPDCAPAGTVKLYRRFNSTLHDFAIFPDTELAAMEGLGYTENGGASFNDVLGYVYLNQDSDGDGLIDGFETLIGTNPFVADTDGDGVGDGVEVLTYPYRDPLRAGADCRDRNPVASFTVTCAGYACSFSAAGSSDDRGIVNYFWDFGDGSTANTPGAAVNHTYAAAGTRTALLTVSDESSQSGQANRAFTVVAPKAANVLYQSVPSVMVAGQSYTVSMTLKNVGSLAWNPVGAQCNAYRWGSNTSTPWGTGRADFAGNVAPGQIVTLSYTVTAPTTPGTYNFQWRMVHECVEWFGDVSPNVVVTVRAAQTKDAQVLSQSVPATMVAGQTYTVSMTLKNVGSQAWNLVGSQCNAYRLGTANSNSWGVWGGRVELPAILGVGQTVTLTFAVTAPGTPGTYDFQWRMVQECVAWFGDLSPNVAVAVRSAQAKDGQVLNPAVPPVMAAGQTYTVSLKVKNVGSLSWSPVGPACNAYRLGSLSTSWNPIRAELPAVLATGQEVVLNFNVTAPATPGTYSFQWRMVHECVEWFGDSSPSSAVIVN